MHLHISRAFSSVLSRYRCLAFYLLGAFLSRIVHTEQVEREAESSHQRTRKVSNQPTALSATSFSLEEHMLKLDSSETKTGNCSHGSDTKLHTTLRFTRVCRGACAEDRKGWFRNDCEPLLKHARWPQTGLPRYPPCAITLI